MVLLLLHERESQQHAARGSSSNGCSSSKRATLCPAWNGLAGYVQQGRSAEAKVAHILLPSSSMGAAAAAVALPALPCNEESRDQLTQLAVTQ